MSVLPPSPSLNLQFMLQKTPEHMMSLFKQNGIVYTPTDPAPDPYQYINRLGETVTAPAGYPRPHFDPVTLEPLGLKIDGTEKLVISGTDFSKFYNQDEGTWISAYYTDHWAPVAVNTQLDSNNEMMLAWDHFLYKKDGAPYYCGNSVFTSGRYDIHAYSYKLGQYRHYKNGVMTFEEIWGEHPTGQTKVSIGDTFAGGNNINGYMKFLLYFPSVVERTLIEKMSTIAGLVS